MTKEMPKYHETFIPILEVLNDLGTLYSKELRIHVRDKYYADLPENLLNETTTRGDNLLFNRINWGTSYLKMAKLLDYPERAMACITEKGKSVLNSGEFTLENLKNDADYINHKVIVEKKSLKENNDNKKIKTIPINGKDPQEIIEENVESMKKEVKYNILEKLKKSNPYDFEKIVQKVLVKAGYGEIIRGTKKSSDGGIDGIMNQDQLGLDKIVIQAKRYENKVNEREIRDFIGAMDNVANKGIFVTTSYFSDSAIDRARNSKRSIVLVDGEELVALMYQHGIGVKTHTTYEIKSMDNDFFDEIN